MDPLSNSVYNAVHTQGDFIRLKLKHQKQDRNARIMFFIVGLLLLGYMAFYGYKSDASVRTMRTVHSEEQTQEPTLNDYTQTL
jgi:hypothetical protein